MCIEYQSAQSPWTSCKGQESVLVRPLQDAAVGKIAVTGSKSFTNRALIIAALSTGRCEVKDILKSEDSYWCIEALKSLGVDIEVVADTAIVMGCGGDWKIRDNTIFIGSGGTTGRFLTSALAFTVPEPVTVTATQQLSERPMKGVFDALTALGARFEFLHRENQFPVKIHPPERTGGKVSMSGSLSSQFISGVLIAAPYADTAVEISIADKIVQEDYVRMTLAAMADFNMPVIASDNLSHMSVNPGQYNCPVYHVEADASTASYFCALAAVTGGKVSISNLNKHTLQPDIQVLSVFEQLGCKVHSDDEAITLEGPEQLQGGFTLDMNQCSDMTLTIAALAPFANARIEIVGVEHIRHHESDRIAVMVETLDKLGIQVEEKPDGMIIDPGSPAFAKVQTFDDHRVAMSLSVLAAAGNGLEILEPGCVSKTCPSFFELIQSLGVEVE